MFKKLCILLIFSKLKVTKLFNRQISYAQLSVHDIHYLKDVKVDYSNCTVIGDRGYISAQVQLICLKLPISDWRYHTDVIKRMEANIPSFCQSEKKN